MNGTIWLDRQGECYIQSLLKLGKQNVIIWAADTTVIQVQILLNSFKTISLPSNPTNKIAFKQKFYQHGTQQKVNMDN